MANVKSDTLHRLIKSLSKSEKRYFRLANQNEANLKYMKLFDFVEQSESIDENELLANEPTLKASQLSNLKAHLYDKILKSLRDFSITKIPSIEIRELIDEAQILFNKSLYRQCSKRLLKAERLATETDNLELQLVILKWKKRVLDNTLDWESRPDVDEIVNDVSRVNSRINNINSFSNLQAKLQSLYRKTGYIKNEDEFKKIERIFDSAMPTVNEAELSISERISLYHVYIGYYFFIQDFQSGMEYAKKWVEIFNQQKSLLRVGLESYISALNYLLIAQNKLQLLDDFQETKKELRMLNKLHPSFYNENIRLKMLKYTFVHEFNSLFLSGSFDKGVELIERLTSGLDGFINQLDAHSRMILYYKTACLYFGNSDFTKSVFWLNKILNSTDADLREDVSGFARILNLICHYELGNIDLIQYNVRSTYRFLLKKDDLLEYHRLILRFLKGLNKHLSEKEVIQRFQQLKEKMLIIQNDRYERGFVYFDMVSWLESQIEKKPIMEVIQGKALKGNSAESQPLIEA